MKILETPVLVRNKEVGDYIRVPINSVEGYTPNALDAFHLRADAARETVAISLETCGPDGLAVQSVSMSVSVEELAKLIGR